MANSPAELKTDTVECKVGANDPWPDGVKLYQPFESDQILLPDNANCLAVQAFLKMCDLKYDVMYRRNAEDMSPTGRVPFLKCGEFLVAELEPLISFVANKGISLTSALDSVQKSDIRAYMSLINTVLGNAELFITWADSETYVQITKERYGVSQPFPFGSIMSYQKRQRVLKRLRALGWLNRTMEQCFNYVTRRWSNPKPRSSQQQVKQGLNRREQVLSEVDSCCSALSDYLEDRKYYFGDKPTELDAMVFAHVFTILATPLPSNQLAATVRGYPKLVEHCQRIEQEYFNMQNT